MLILFGDAREESGIIYSGVLNKIEIDEPEKITRYTFHMQSKFDNPKPLSNLILINSNKPMSNKNIRPYALVKIPEQIDEWVDEVGLSSISIKKKSGEEIFTFGEMDIDSTLLDFWKWAFSDLNENTLRGILGEYIVACALGINKGVQTNWKPYDLDYKGVKIEIKTSAYIQSWWQKQFSKINFGISKTKAYYIEKNMYDKIPKRQSDFYIFCVFEHKVQETLDPMNLEQWRFYIIATPEINKVFKNAKTISLAKIKKIRHITCNFDKLKEKMNEKITEAIYEKN